MHGCFLPSMCFSIFLSLISIFIHSHQTHYHHLGPHTNPPPPVLYWTNWFIEEPPFLKLRLQKQSFDLKTTLQSKSSTTDNNIPISPCSYSCTISLQFGTPPQTISFMLDTASKLVWFPCFQNYHCTDCTFSNTDPIEHKLSWLTSHPH